MFALCGDISGDIVVNKVGTFGPTWAKLGPTSTTSWSSLTAKVWPNLGAKLWRPTSANIAWIQRVIGGQGFPQYVGQWFCLTSTIGWIRCLNMDHSGRTLTNFVRLRPSVSRRRPILVRIRPTRSPISAPQVRPSSDVRLRKFGFRVRCAIVSSDLHCR